MSMPEMSYREEVSCAQCGKKFLMEDWGLQIPEPRLCSQKCANEYSH